ncbi:hypothetical protein PaG_00605 [Moesziomyces aphidis]|uniref:Uncharacterized protein n=1 Tax=Moesziomyces aphidis TaxID=84754 RepID=W3VT32_MOEAP|nr:hypothetical protein PaG_00605 [Moesziomyces aphidis]
MYLDDMLDRRRSQVFDRDVLPPVLSPAANDYFLRILAFLSGFVAAVLSIEVEEAETKLLALDVSGCLFLHSFTALGLLGGPAPFMALLLDKDPGPKPVHRMSRATRRKFDHCVEVARRYEVHPDRMPADPGLPTELDIVDGLPLPPPDPWSLNRVEYSNVIELFFDGVSERFHLARQSAIHWVGGTIVPSSVATTAHYMGKGHGMLRAPFPGCSPHPHVYK